MGRMRDFWEQRQHWATVVFGPRGDRGPEGPLKHLLKEVQETLDNPSDLTEYADCLFLLFDAVYRAGFTYDELLDGAFYKLAVNRRRKWGKRSADGIVEHIKE